MSWYKTGTIQVAASGTTATGTGTNFFGNVRIGDGISIEGSAALHEVTGVTSDTQLTFQPPYAGAAGSGLAYRVAPVLGYDKELSDAFNQIRLQWGTTLSSIQPWSTAPTPAAARTELGAGIIGNELFAVNTTQEAIQALGLGTSSALNVTASSTDTTANRVMKAGDGGWMGDIPIGVADIDDKTTRGWRSFSSATIGTKPAGVPFGYVLTLGISGNTVIQEAWDTNASTQNSRKRFYRTAFGEQAWGTWQEIAVVSRTVTAGAGSLIGVPNAIWANAGSLTDAQLSAQVSYAGALEIREVNLATTTKSGNTDYAPALTFHYGGYAVNRLWMSVGANLFWGQAMIWHQGNLAIGTSGDAIGKLNTINTWSAPQIISDVLSYSFKMQAPSSTNNSTYIEFQNYQGSRVGYLGKAAPGSSDLFLSATNSIIFLAGNGERWGINTAGTLFPITDNAYQFGAPSNRPTQLFAATATIGTSDAREKTSVRELTDAELDAAIALADEFGAYQWLHAIGEKGSWARDHIGMTVQRAIEVMEAHGLEPFNYGFICYDQWPDELVEHPAEYEQIKVPAELDEEGNELAPARIEQGELIREAWTELVRPAGDRYSFRGEELQAFILAGIRARQRRLEGRLKAIEEAINQ